MGGQRYLARNHHHRGRISARVAKSLFFSQEAGGRRATTTIAAVFVPNRIPVDAQRRDAVEPKWGMGVTAG